MIHVTSVTSADGCGFCQTGLAQASLRQSRSTEPEDGTQTCRALRFQAMPLAGQGHQLPAATAASATRCSRGHASPCLSSVGSGVAELMSERSACPLGDGGGLYHGGVQERVAAAVKLQALERQEPGFAELAMGTEDF